MNPTDKMATPPMPPMPPAETTRIVEYTGGRDVFMELLKTNPGVFIFKFGAEWCSPCKKIKKFVDRVSLVLPTNIMYIFSVDVDECFDLYAYLKQKKMVSGIPVMLAYKTGNTTYAPDASVSGTDETQLKHFFDTCLKMMS
uniref:Thioredoxin domain-containing protein n=1 Tax=viral metagenome TaxID=1070528 RepID=A0A6C0F040_9ZZZZ